MRTITDAVMNRLKAEVPELKWIDLNKGQLNVKDRPSLRLPAALISLAVKPKRNITDTIQECDGTVKVRLVFDAIGRSSVDVPAADRDIALAPNDVIAKVYKTLQGFYTQNFDSLTRTFSDEEQTHHPLYVWRLEFKTEFEDVTADE